MKPVTKLSDFWTCKYQWTKFYQLTIDMMIGCNINLPRLEDKLKYKRNKWNLSFSNFSFSMEKSLIKFFWDYIHKILDNEIFPVPCVAVLGKGERDKLCQPLKTWKGQEIAKILLCFHQTINQRKLIEVWPQRWW